MTVFAAFEPSWQNCERDCSLDRNRFPVAELVDFRLQNLQFVRRPFPIFNDNIYDNLGSKEVRRGNIYHREKIERISRSYCERLALGVSCDWSVFAITQVIFLV